MAAHSLDPAQRRPDDAAWTGAEIQACCRLAALLDPPLMHAAQNFVPIAATAAESIERLRAWASGRCQCRNARALSAEPATPARRSVSRKPSNN
ncbi:MAG: hypothetical protein IT428_03765 [Planctomycetaceae bacterium]|nr:hypothetical protein [Planctomycetaceae bacterium]